MVTGVQTCALPISKDDKFLTLAVAAQADYIISGDADLLVLHPFQGIHIIKPADFLDIIL